MHQLTPTMGDELGTYSVLKVRVGTVNRSAAHRW
jgi:hypothetical protein